MKLRALALGMGAAVMLVSTAVPVMAADLGGGPPPGSVKDAPLPPLPLYSWSGLYIGVHAGYGWSDLDWTGGGTTVGDSGEGWVGGGQIGYNWQRGALVFGVEADISGSGIDGSTVCPNPADDCRTRRQLAGLRARAAWRHGQRQPHAVLRHGRRRLGRRRLHRQRQARLLRHAISAGWRAAASSTC